MPDRSSRAVRHAGFPWPGSELHRSTVDSRNGRSSSALAGDRLASSAAQVAGTPGRVSRASHGPGRRNPGRRLRTHAGSRRQAERCGGERVADVQARVTEPVTGEPGLRDAACRRLTSLRVVGTRDRSRSANVSRSRPASAGVPGREQPEAEIPHATFGCALLDRPPPRRPPRRGDSSAWVLALAATRRGDASGRVDRPVSGDHPRQECLAWTRRCR